MSELYCQTVAAAEELYLSLLICCFPLEPIFRYLLVIAINVCRRKVVKKIIKDAWSTLPYMCFALHTFRILKTFGISVVLASKKLILSSFKCIINYNNPQSGVLCIVYASVFSGPHSTSEIQLLLSLSIHLVVQSNICMFPQN